MADIKPRYNSGIQRCKGLLEMGAALYDTSLSRTYTRSGTSVPQINSRVGTRLTLRLGAETQTSADGSLEISFAIDGLLDHLTRVATKDLSLIWVNPNASLALAYKGCAPFKEKLPLRALAVFPSWDATVLAVHESTGITSIEEIAKRRYPLRVSTRQNNTPPFDEDATMSAVAALCAAGGFTLDDIRAWGGSMHGVQRPSHTARSEAIVKGEVDAIFDEGLGSWGQFALERGFRILPVEGAVKTRVLAAGYDLVTITPQRIPALKQPVQSIDFCGWPMIVHAEMEDAVAYALCEAIEARRDLIPTDNYKPMDFTQLCTITEETPRGAPLHPGAERFYRERGYLKS